MDLAHLKYCKLKGLHWISACPSQMVMPSFATLFAAPSQPFAAIIPTFLFSTDDDDAELPIKAKNSYAVKGVSGCLGSARLCD
jgi:hypothetical protein